MFLFPKLGVLPGEESLLILIMWFIDAWYNKWAIQVLPFLTVLGMTTGLQLQWVAELITSLDIYHQFSSKFIQELHWVAQIILTLQC